jgi:hypothetical protein
MELRTALCLRYLDKMLEFPVAKNGGDLIECGVGCGVTSFAMAQWILKRQQNRRLYSCDTFAGLPYTDEASTAGVTKSDLAVGECGGMTLGDFDKQLITRGIRSVVVPVPGLFEDTLEPILCDKKFAFAWVDADLQFSTEVAFRFLHPRLVPNAIIGFHDYGFVRCPGIKIVVDGEVRPLGYKELHCEGDCIFFLRVS